MELICWQKYLRRSNSSIENIGARRLHTIIEKVLDDISFNATDKSGEKIIINRNYVQNNLGDLVKDIIFQNLLYNFFSLIKSALCLRL